MTNGGYRRRVEPVERVRAAQASVGAALLRGALAAAGLAGVVVSGVHLWRLMSLGALESGAISSTSFALTLALPVLAVGAFVASTSGWSRPPS
jgi:hypothetical protein